MRELSPTLCPIISTNFSEAEEELEWGVKTQIEENYYNYYLETVSYKNQGKILWQIYLPDRIKGQAIWRTKQPIDVRNYYGFPFLIGTLITEQTVFIADSSGVLVLDRQTGEILVDKSAESSSDLFFVDVGSATLITPNQRCNIQVRGGQFFSQCGDYIVYFNRRNLWVWSLSGKLLDSTNYSHQDHNIETHQSLNYQMRISLKTMTVEITGFVGER